MSESEANDAQAKQAQEPDAQAKEEERIWYKRRRMRSLALAWALVLLAILFFIVTIVRLGPMVANRPL